MVMRKMFKNKMFLMALFSCILSLIAFVSVGYAWFVTVKSNSTSFVASVGESGYEYQFSQVIGNNIIQSDTYTTEKAMPGEMNIFLLILSNTSEDVCNLNVYFSDLHSERFNDGVFTSDYQNAYEKIQYSYSYRCDLLVEVPYKTEIKEKENELITVPNDEKIEEWGWKKITTNSMISPEFTYFNTINSDGEDLTNYYLLEDFKLEAGKTVVLYFTVKFQPEPIFPSIYQDIIPSDISFDGRFYSNQRLVIENLIIDNSMGE